MGRTKKAKVEEQSTSETSDETVDTGSTNPYPVSEKQKLLDLYQTLKDLGIRSISDLENLIARTEN